MNFALFMSGLSMAVGIYSQYKGSGDSSAAYIMAQIWIAAHWVDSRKETK